jgi:hypothetical protein
MLRTYSTGMYSHPFVIVLAHLNRDDHLDIAVTNTGSETIGVFLRIVDIIYTVECTINGCLEWIVQIL